MKNSIKLRLLNLRGVWKVIFCICKEVPSMDATSFLVCAPWARSNGCKSRTCPDSGKCIAEQQGESNQHDINISNYAAVSHIRNNSMRHWKTSGICTHSLNDNNQRTLISSQMTSYQCNRDSLPFFRQFSGRMRYYERIQDYGPVLNSKITVS